MQLDLRWGIVMSLIQGATITVYDNNGILIFSGTSDANGEVSISALDRGIYNIQISKNGYATTTYAINIIEYKTYVLNLPATSNTIYAMMVTETMAEAPNISKNTSVTEILAETPSVALGSAYPYSNPTMSIAPTVIKLPATWRLIICFLYPDGGLITGAFTPSGAPTYIVDTASGSTLATTATTKQFNLYSYEKLNGGANVNDNSGIHFEAVNTAHNYTVPAQTAGSIQSFLVAFKSAWEIATSASGPGTLNFTGTYEVEDGYTFAVIATVNSGHFFSRWELDGEVISTSTSYTCPVQQRGTSHTLVAIFV